MKKLLKDLGILTTKNQPRKVTIDRKPPDLEFLMSREVLKVIPLWRHRRTGPSLKDDVAILTSLPMFGESHAASFYPDVEDKKRIEALETTLSKSKY